MKKPTLAETCARVAALFDASAALATRASDHYDTGARNRARLCKRAAARLNCRALGLLAAVAGRGDPHRGDFWARRLDLLNASSDAQRRASVARSRLRAPAARAA